MEVAESSKPEDKEISSTSSPKNCELPQCKIKRNYSCNQCSYSTQNPRSHLEHLRDIHGEKLFINKCCLCLYASRHYQKLVRHMKMVHGSIEGISEQTRKRPYSEISALLLSRKIPSPPLPPLPPLPEPVETTIDMNNLSNDLELSRNTLKDIAALYFAQGHIDQIMIQMEQADAMHFLTTRKSKSLYDELKSSVVGAESLTCNNCGYAGKCLSEYVIHRKSCSYSNEMPLRNLIRCQNCEQWCKSRVDLLHHQCIYSNDVTINLSSASTRCQHCRQWCKSYADLANHLESCLKASDLQSKDLLLDTNTKQSSRYGSLYLENASLADGTKRQCAILTDERKQEAPRERNAVTSYFAIETAPGYGKVIKKMALGEELPSESLKKVFKCPRCAFWATTASRFHIHIVGHLNKKPFKCSLCAYCSNWRWDITKHIRIKTIRSNCHKNARVVMSSEAGRVDYAKYNRYNSLIKLTDEDGAAKLTKSCEVIEDQGSAQPIPPNDSLLRDNKRDSNFVNTPISEVEVEASKQPHLVEASDDVNNNVAEKKIVFKSEESAIRQANDNSALSQETLHSRDSPMSSFSSVNASKDNQIFEYLKTLHVNQDAGGKSELNKKIAEPKQISKNTPQNKKDIEVSSNCSRTTASVNDTNQRDPSPFRCGHCHQVSNWKHVIQRHCRLKHSGHLRIEAFDRSSDRCHPVYRPFEIYSNRNAYNLPLSSANELSDSRHDHHSQNSFHLSSDQDSTLNNLEISRLPSASKQFKCPSCPYISKTQNQLNLHLGNHNTASVIHPDPVANNTSSSDIKLLNNLTSEDTVSVLKKCPYCPYQCACAKSFRHHLEYHICVSNRSEKHNCEHCDFSSTSEDIIVEHTQIHFAANNNKKPLTSYTSYDNLELIVTADNGKSDEADRPTSTVIGFKSDGNTENEKMPSPSQKTILVNPKTGQVIKRGQ